MFTPAELALVAQLSLHLVTIDLAKIAHSAASLAGFVERPPADGELVLGKLERLRILRRIPHPSDPVLDRYEIFHDMLGKAIVNWRPTYLGKVAAARQKAKFWNVAKGFVLAIVCVFAAFLAIGFMSVSAEKTKAEHAARDAVAANELKDTALAEAEELRTEAEIQRDEAIRTRQRLEEQLDELKTLTELDRAAREEKLRKLERQLADTMSFSTNSGSISEIQQAVAKFREEVNQAHQAGKAAVPDYQQKLQDKLNEIDRTVQSIATPLVARLNDHSDSINSLTFAAANYLATASADGTAIVWGVDGKKLRTFTGSSSKEGVLTLAFAKNPQYLVTGSAGQTLRLFDWHGAKTKSIENGKLHRDGISKVTFSPDFNLFACSSADQNVSLIFSRDKWLGPNFADARLTIHRWPHRGIVSNVSFSPDGDFVVTSCDDHTVRIFATESPFDLLDSADCGAPTRHFVFSPKDQGVVAGAAGARCVIWEWEKQPKKPTYRQMDGSDGHIGGITGVAFSDDGGTLATVACDGECILWDVATRKLLVRIPTAIGGRLYGVDWDKANLAIIGEDGQMEIWNTADLRSPVRISATQAHQGIGRGIRFSPDGNLLATWSGRIRENAMDAKGKAAKFTPTEYKAPDNSAALWDVKAILLNAPRSKR